MVCIEPASRNVVGCWGGGEDYAPSLVSSSETPILNVFCSRCLYISTYKTAINIYNIYRPQRSCGKVMFLHTPVCPGGSLSRGSLSNGSLSRGVSVWGVSVQGGSLSRGVFVQGVSVQGDLCLGGLCPIQGVSVQGVSVQGVSVQEVSVQGVGVKKSLSRGGVSVLGGLCQGDPPIQLYVVCILLEYIQVYHVISHDNLFVC